MFGKPVTLSHLLLYYFIIPRAGIFVYKMMEILTPKEIWQWIKNKKKILPNSFGTVME